MKIKNLYEDKSFFQKLKSDQRMSNMLAIAFKLDNTVNRTTLANLGPKPDIKDIIDLYEKTISQSLRNTQYGNIDDGKFNEWITRLYCGGAITFEDIQGEIPDQLAGYRALNLRNIIPKQYSDINKFKNFDMLKNYLTRFRVQLQNLQDEAKLEMAKRDQKSIVLIDNDKYHVSIPLNYGACYMFNVGEGVKATFCTGSSSGLHYFKHYSSNGPLIQMFNKKLDPNDINSKFQIHAPSNQAHNATQNNNNWYYGHGDRIGAKFPGIMKKVLQIMTERKNEIEEKGREYNFNWDIDDTISRIKNGLPRSLTDETKEKPEKPETD